MIASRFDGKQIRIQVGLFSPLSYVSVSHHLQINFNYWRRTELHWFVCSRVRFSCIHKRKTANKKALNEQKKQKKWKAIEESFASCAQKINLFASCTFHLLFAQYARKSRFQRLNIDWMNEWAHEWISGWVNEWTQYACKVPAMLYCTIERGGCSVRRSYLSSYQLRILYTYISTLVCVCLCVCVCELTVSWQLKRLSRVYWLAAGAACEPKQQSCNSGLGYCNENLFKLQNANCIRGLRQRNGRM